MRDLTIYLSLGRSKLFEFGFMNLNFLTIIFLLFIFLTRGNFAVAKNQASSASLGDLCALAVNLSSSRITTGSIATIIPSQTQSFTVKDRLTTDTYDANGNTTVSSSSSSSLLQAPSSSVTDVYSFDNRLIRRINSTGQTIDLTYTPDGHRLTKFITQNGLTQRLVHYLTDSNNPTGYAQVIEEKDPLAASGQELKKVNLYGHDLIATEPRSVGVSPTSSIFYSYDGLGSVRSITNETGDLQETYDYDAYGTLIGLNKRNPTTGLLESSNLSSTIPNLQSDYLYTGEQWDADLGMYFLRARYLNTNTGRFHSQDSYEGDKGSSLTLHKYLYANGNPAMFADPSGRTTLGEVSATTGFLLGLSSLVFSPSVANAPAPGDPIYSDSSLVDLAFNVVGGQLIGEALGATVGWLSSKVSLAIIFKGGSILRSAEAKVLSTEGEIPSYAAESFANLKYIRDFLREDIIVYRAELQSGMKAGKFFGTVKPTSMADAEIMYNINKYGSPRFVVSTYRIKAQTKVFRGNVLGGSGGQIYLENPSVAEKIGEELLPFTNFVGGGR
jgi:RHS repeat-associated protein